MSEEDKLFIEKHTLKIKELRLLTGQTFKNCVIDTLDSPPHGFLVIKRYKAVPIEELEELHYINRNAIASITVAPKEEKKLYSALL